MVQVQPLHLGHGGPGGDAGLAGQRPDQRAGEERHRLGHRAHPTRQVREVLSEVRGVQGVRHTWGVLWLPLAHRGFQPKVDIVRV